jgi:hypothetical protein
MNVIENGLRPRVELQRLAQSTPDERGAASWWASVARNLDLLTEELEVADTLGLVRQVVADAPHLAPLAVHLTSREAKVRAGIAEIRIQVGALAGAPLADAIMAGRLVMLLQEIGGFLREGDLLLVDAYERDLGGE